MGEKKRKWRIKRRRRIKSREFSIPSANTAVAITKALPNIPLSIVVGAMGAIQTALISAQPLPPKGYATGGFTRALAFEMKPDRKLPAGCMRMNM